MRKFLVLTIILIAVVLPKTIYAQQNKRPAYQLYKDQQKEQQQQYIDQKGNTYYLDDKGNHYYIDKGGNHYYLDSDGYGYYLDRYGNPYYIDENGKPYYLNSEGRPNYLDKYNNQKNDYYDDRPERFRLAIGGGYSYRLGESYDNDWTSDDLRNAFNIDLETQYFFYSGIGIGLNANYVRASTSYENLSQSFFYVGPSLSFRSDIDRFLLVYNAGLGALFFNQTADNHYLKYSKTTLASIATASGEYKLSPNMSLGLKLSFIYGSFDTPYYSDMPDLDMSASSFNITAFVSFRAK